MRDHRAAWLPVGQLICRCSRFRRSASRTPDELASILALRSLARRIEAATTEAAELEREILNHVRTLVPELLDEPGVGPIVAAQVIVTWSHRDLLCQAFQSAKRAANDDHSYDVLCGRCAWIVATVRKHSEVEQL